MCISFHGIVRGVIVGDIAGCSPDICGHYSHPQYLPCAPFRSGDLFSQAAQAVPAPSRIGMSKAATSPTTRKDYWLQVLVNMNVVLFVLLSFSRNLPALCLLYASPLSLLPSLNPSHSHVSSTRSPLLFLPLPERGSPLRGFFYYSFLHSTLFLRPFFLLLSAFSLCCSFLTHFLLLILSFFTLLSLYHLHLSGRAALH